MGKKIPVWQCLLVMVVMIAALMWSIVVDDGGEPHIALIIAASFAAIIGVANGWKWNYMEQGILASINRSMQAILILAIVGAMICSWLAAGTIPSMMYYGIKVISPKVFLVTACILCSIVSLATGSSWCCTHWCRYSSRIPCCYDSRCCSIRCLLRRQDVPIIRYNKPCSCNGRRNSVRTHQAHGLYNRYFLSYRFSCLRSNGLHACFQQRG